MAGIKYHEAQDVAFNIKKICTVLDMDHIDLNRVFCIRSIGTGSRNIIARCHSLPKILQQVLNIEPAYVIEVISEKYDRADEEEKMKILIHELAHIPKTFGGGFVHHNVVRDSFINKLYKKYVENLRRDPFPLTPQKEMTETTEKTEEPKKDFSLGNWLDD
ncbi:MAG: putative metallopeptidase [Candidatus Pacearchaeota archaeon]|nr:putative metallopeptidase [Candidatus Pacearchaeota archaeon]